MTRKQALQAIKGAGAQGDQRAFLRLYTENRISYAVAITEYRAGRRFARFVVERDAKTPPDSHLGALAATSVPNERHALGASRAAARRLKPMTYPNDAWGLRAQIRAKREARERFWRDVQLVAVGFTFFAVMLCGGLFALAAFQ